MRCECQSDSYSTSISLFGTIIGWSVVALPITRRGGACSAASCE